MKRIFKFLFFGFGLVILATRNEMAFPGYHALFLDGQKVLAELTATPDKQ
ncbi:MAG: hypothetical protein J7K53_08060 [Bacteroidales bacterium]|nr:hypothetical protein [Bacteroidales bacterium]